MTPKVFIGLVNYVSVYMCTCMYVYPYHIKTGLKVGSVSIHAYAYLSSIWIAKLGVMPMDDGSVSGPGLCQGPSNDVNI